ncbi:hypothetical protein EO244_16460 [Ancylomarina salipaludis]|uniref:Lipoprotein n=1 Tax=Ancylomarina salipaludis TaxID=2501299 RepID=A0A4Q1JHL8_9BACT|nr:hypothetical protein [Ancylomarina salipaludis]RXQ87399.1 hypothetical protein EO244_16460 [Ancylomarina salipaludis]
MRIIIYLITFVVLTGCIHQDEKEHLKFEQISLSSGLCMGCDYNIDVDIFKNGKVVLLYTDYKAGEKRNLYTGQLPEKFKDSLVNLFLGVDLEFVESYQNSELDTRKYQIFIEYSKNEIITNKVFIGSSFETRLAGVVKFIMSIHKHIELEPLNKNYTFKTDEIFGKPPYLYVEKENPN